LCQNLLISDQIWQSYLEVFHECGFLPHWIVCTMHIYFKVLNMSNVYLMLQRMLESLTITLISGAACFRMTAMTAVRTHRRHWSPAPHSSCQCSTRMMSFLLLCHQHHRVTRHPSQCHQPPLHSVNRRYRFHQIFLRCCVARVRRLMNRWSQGYRPHRTSRHCLRVLCHPQISSCHLHLLSLLL